MSWNKVLPWQISSATKSARIRSQLQIGARIPARPTTRLGPSRALSRQPNLRACLLWWLWPAGPEACPRPKPQAGPRGATPLFGSLYQFN
jgi:hypothetical protein